MLYNTGTIAINGNTATGTGTNWTAPASQIRLGQTLMVLSNPVQLFQITAINSATSLTVTPAASPALTGQKYAILVTDALSVDGLAQSISQLINEYDENIGGWETFATTSANQSITVTINGKAVTIPAIGGLARKGSNSDITELKGLTTALSIAQGGTGATKAEDARSNLGLGSSATRNAYSSTGDILSVGDFGLGALAPKLYNSGVPGGNIEFFRAMENANFPSLERYIGTVFSFNTGITCALAARMSGVNPTFVYRAQYAGNFGEWQTLYSTANTTKASDGTIKAASPVARIVKSQEENQRKDVDEDGFTWCGCGTANAEAGGINISRLDVGVYVLTGSAGLASEGWQLLPPMDPAGMGELGIVEAEQTESGGLTIRLFRRKYMLTESGEMVKTKGEPIDVPANSWIDIRLDMPEDSIWNKRIAEASLEQKVNAEVHQS
ncbi:phage tail protein [Leclercia pneumoniae]|uniref:phage tail fiber protein n=1 Tax=Leclercia pneumoniae TaxID=2815358 RepID=UPI0030CF252C